jgi:hypothetical protein
VFVSDSRKAAPQWRTTRLLFELTGFELGNDLVDAPVMEQQNSRYDRLGDMKEEDVIAARSLDHAGEAGSRERRAPRDVVRA